MIIGLLVYIVIINTLGIAFGIYGYGSAKGWWR
jgi:hypothetical protein